jgi:hypothetical protein
MLPNGTASAAVACGVACGGALAEEALGGSEVELLSVHADASRAAVTKKAATDLRDMAIPLSIENVLAKPSGKGGLQSR